MVIYRCCRLRAAVAMRAVEIERGDTMLAEGACEGDAVIPRFGSVISHIFMVVLLPVWALEQWVYNLRAGKLLPAGSAESDSRLQNRYSSESCSWFHFVPRPPSNS